jgi:hypothetical protein
LLTLALVNKSAAVVGGRNNNAPPSVSRNVSSHVQTTSMRIIITIFLVIFYLLATGQNIEYRHDSLFINKFFVDAQTNKATIDSLLNTKGKTKTSKDNDKLNPATGKKAVRTTDFYYDLGLFFRRYDYDTTKLSVGIKLYSDTDPKEDKQSELTETFKGQLFIADNYINEKRTIEQLKQLNYCTVTVSQASLGSYSTIIGGDIIYEQNIIRLLFDRKTKELKSVFIHHNFKDR